MLIQLFLSVYLCDWPTIRLSLCCFTRQLHVLYYFQFFCCNVFFYSFLSPLYSLYSSLYSFIFLGFGSFLVFYKFIFNFYASFMFVLYINIYLPYFLYCIASSLYDIEMRIFFVFSFFTIHHKTYLKSSSFFYHTGALFQSVLGVLVFLLSHFINSFCIKSFLYGLFLLNK